MRRRSTRSHPRRSPSTRRGGTGSGDRYEEWKERREPHGGVRLASPTAQEMASDAPILHWRGATSPSWNNPEAEPPGILFVPDAGSRLTAASRCCRSFIDIIVLI